MATNLAARMSEFGRNVLDVVRRISQYWDRFRQDAGFRRHTLFLIFCVAVLLSEIFLLSIDLPLHRDLIKHTIVTATIVLLPFTVMAMAARLPVGRRFVKRRFIIRPFGSLASTSAYEGAAIAAFLHREIIAWSAGVAGSVEGTASAPPTISLSLAGASLPLHWLWNQVRTLITGQKDVVIDGLLIEAGASPQLRIWTNDSQYTWAEVLTGDMPDALDAAVTRLTPRILKSLDPVLLARIYAAQWNYEEAVPLMASDDTEDHQLELAAMNLNGEYLIQAEKHLEQAAKRRHLGQSDYTTLQHLQGDLHIRRGNFGEGRRILQAALKDPMCAQNELHTVYTLIADSFAYEEDFPTAIETYARAQKEGRAGLCQVTGEKSLDDLATILDRRLYGRTKDDALTLLWDLHWVAQRRAQCSELHDQDPLVDLEEAQTIINVIRELDTQSAATELQAAVSAADLGSYYLKKQDVDLFAVFSEEAIRLFDNAILLLEQTLKITEDDVDALVNLAWANHGKAACLLQRRRTTPTEPGNPLEYGAENLMRMFASFSEEGKRTFAMHFQRARQLATDKRFDGELQKSAATFLEALLHLEPATVYEARDGLASMHQSTVTQMQIEGELALPTLGTTAENRAAEAGLDSEELLKLFRLIYEFLLSLIRQDSSRELDRWLYRAELMIAADAALSRTSELFNSLADQRSRRCRAEAQFGHACLWAIQSHAGNAAGCLQLAGTLAGENSRAYMNRAILDNDFNAIRRDSHFATLWSKEQSAMLKGGIATSA